MLYYKLNTVTGEAYLGEIQLSDVNFTAGAGLSFADNTLNVNVDDESLQIVDDEVQVKLNPSGAIIKDTNGLKVKINDNFLQIVANTLRVSEEYCNRARVAFITGDGTTKNFTYTHNVNNDRTKVEVYELSTGESVMVDIVRTSNNAIQIKFEVAPPVGKQYRVLVLGMQIV